MREQEVDAEAGPVIWADDGPVRWWRLNRPSALNALNASVIAALEAEVDRLEGQTDVLCVVLTGAGEKAFSAGADLDELDGLSGTEAATVLGHGQRLFRRIECSPVPVIAAINGYDLGGGLELALACSFIVASDNARFGLPETKLGLIPGYGGTQRLPRLIGRQNALYVMLTGRPITASRAFDLGLLPEPPVGRDELEGRAGELAALVAANGPGAVRAVLAATDAAGDRGLRYEAGPALRQAEFSLASAEKELYWAHYRLQHAGERLAGFGKLSQLRRHGRDEKSSTLDQIERFTGDVQSAESKIAHRRDEIEHVRSERDRRSAWDGDHDWPAERLRGVDSELASLARQEQSPELAGRTHLLERNPGPDQGGGYQIAGVEIRPPARGPDLGIDLGP